MLTTLQVSDVYRVEASLLETYDSLNFSLKMVRSYSWLQPGRFKCNAMHLGISIATSDTQQTIEGYNCLRSDRFLLLLFRPNDATWGLNRMLQRKTQYWCRVDHADVAFLLHYCPHKYIANSSDCISTTGHVWDASTHHVQLMWILWVSTMAIGARVAPGVTCMVIIMHLEKRRIPLSIWYSKEHVILLGWWKTFSQMEHSTLDGSRCLSPLVRFITKSCIIDVKEVPCDG